MSLPVLEQHKKVEHQLTEMDAIVNNLWGACLFGNKELLYSLLEKGAPVNIQYDGNGLLAAAITMGQFQVVQPLLDYGAEVSTRNKYGSTALHAASTKGHLETINLLLDRGADVNALDDNGVSALAEAGRCGHMESVKLLISRGALVSPENGHSPLLFASADGPVEVVLFLLEQGATVNTKNIYGVSAIYAASRSGRAETVKLLLNHGAEVDAVSTSGASPLIKASFNGHTETVHILLDHGAQVNIQDEDGMSALLVASISGHVEIVEVLLSHGARIDVHEKYGLSPLIGASMCGHAETVKALLDHGVQADDQQSNGTSALLRACIAGHTDTVKTLVDRGAQVHSKEGHHSALNITSWMKHSETLQILIDSVSKTDTIAAEKAQENHQKALQLTLFSDSESSQEGNKDYPETYVKIYQTMEAQDRIVQKIAEVQSSFVTPSAADIAKHKPPLSKAFRELLPLASHWQKIGVWLGLPADELMKIGNKNHNRERDCLREMLEKWLKMIEPLPTWETLIGAVKMMDQKKAQDIYDKYLQLVW